MRYVYSFIKIANGNSIENQLNRQAEMGWRFISFYGTDYMVFEKYTKAPPRETY